MTVFELHEIFLHVYWVARPRSIAGNLSVHMDVTEFLVVDRLMPLVFLPS